LEKPLRGCSQRSYGLRADERSIWKGKSGRCMATTYMATTHIAAKLHGKLRTLQCNEGGWGFQADQQAMEPTCLGILALRRNQTNDLELALHSVERLQNSDGSWPAFAGDDPEGCWTTSLAVLTLIAIRRQTKHVQMGIRWLLDARGREANWFWRWKFQTVDKSVQFDPAKYGWSWILGTTSWVIPTAFCLIALRQVKNHGLYETAGVVERIHMGMRMLFDRMCRGGGWNAGNGMAFGMQYSAYIDATAIALLALCGHEKQPGVQASLAWLMNRLPGCRSPYSLAWGTLALAAYRHVNREVEKTLVHTTNALSTLIERVIVQNDSYTVALCALALEAAEGDNVFEVLG
jgi:hypothetical protein